MLAEDRSEGPRVQRETTHRSKGELMRMTSRWITLPAALALLASTAVASGPLKKCPVDALVAGTVCMDKYEASAWYVPGPTTTNKSLVAKIQAGKATTADLAAGGAIFLGASSPNYAPCTAGGQNCDTIFAVSLPGVTPSGYATWFEAEEACANAGKRLPSNAEWQVAAMGTPDPGPDNGTTDCNTNGVAAVSTGSRSACVSRRGAYDMVGNLQEWVADWVPRSQGCGSWTVGASPTGDLQCMVEAAFSGEPGAPLRGGAFNSGTSAGPLAVNSGFGLVS